RQKPVLFPKIVFELKGRNVFGLGGSLRGAVISSTGRSEMSCLKFRVRGAKFMGRGALGQHLANNASGCQGPFFNSRFTIHDSHGIVSVRPGLNFAGSSMMFLFASRILFQRADDL